MSKKDKVLNEIIISSYKAGYAKGFYEGRYTKVKDVSE